MDYYIDGSGSLTKLGAGTLTLPYGNDYTGATTVNAGTLIVNGTSGGTGAVTVANGSVQGGTGTLAAAATLTHSSTLNPGGNAGANGSAAYVGTLTVGALTLTSSGKAAFDLNSGTACDQTNGNETGNVVWNLYGQLDTVFFNNTDLNNQVGWFNSNYSVLSGDPATRDYYDAPADPAGVTGNTWSAGTQALEKSESQYRYAQVAANSVAIGPNW